MKALGVTIGVFVAWMAAAFVISAMQHVGQVYDPTWGWRIDHSQDDVSALWLGRAVEYGFVVAIGSGLFYWFKNRVVKVTITKN